MLLESLGYTTSIKGDDKQWLLEVGEQWSATNSFTLFPTIMTCPKANAMGYNT